MKSSRMSRPWLFLILAFGKYLLLIKYLLPFHKVVVIKGFPLSNGDTDDILIWQGNNLLRVPQAEYYSSIVGQSSDNSQTCHLWRQLWETNEIKLFFWKVCGHADLLPTKINLFRRKVIFGVICGNCEEQGDVIRAL